MNEFIEKIFKDAEAEVNNEKIDFAKKQFKAKMKELATAKRVVANIEREIEDLKLEISHDLA